MVRNILQKNKDHKLWNLYDLWFWLTAQAAFVCCCNYLRYTVDHSNCWQLTGSLQLAAVSCSSFSSQYLCSIYKKYWIFPLLTCSIFCSNWSTTSSEQVVRSFRYDHQPVLLPQCRQHKHIRPMLSTLYSPLHWAVYLIHRIWFKV